MGMRGESLDPTLWIWDRKWSLTLYQDSQLLVIIFSIIFNETRTFCHIDCRLLNQPCPTNTSILSIPTSDASQAFAQVALRCVAPTFIHPVADYLDYVSATRLSLNLFLLHVR